MTLAARRPRITVVALAALAVAASACSPSSGSSPSTGTVVSPSAAVETASPSATPAATATPTVARTASPTPEATAEPTPCAVQAESGRPPSDRLVDVVASTSTDADHLTFVFGRDSIESPGGPPRAEFSEAEPPYTFGPSGLPIEMVGERVVQVVLRQMSLQADTGDPVYQGPPRVSPDYPALRHAVMYDESEGVVGWYVGYDGPGCVTLATAGDKVTLTFAH